MKRFLIIFSYLFHPIFISFFGAISYFFFVKDNFVNTYIIPYYLLEIIIVTVFIPITFFYLLLHFKWIDGIMVADVSQRKIPLLANAILLFFLIAKVITWQNFPEMFFYYLGGIVSSLLCFAFAFFKQKVSMHMVGISGLTVLLFGLSVHFETRSILLLSVFLIINGLVATSRLVMKAHSTKELFMGLLIGSLPQIYFLYYWL
ncbi:MAG: hypothetical protein QM535_04070 [Limnohabitans sp.]|nr:hypothetical protein [Limnohabitans sp.]